MPEERVAQSALADLEEVPAESRWVRSGAVGVHLLDYGGDAPPMVVVPGITSPAITWDFAVRDLSDLVRPIVLDVRGRGRSDVASSYQVDDYADDLTAVVDGLELDRPVLLGHSMGARVVAATALRRGFRAAATIAVDPPLSGPSRDPYPMTLEAFREQLSAARRGATPEEIALTYPGWPRRELELRARWLASCDEQAVADSHRSFEADDFFAWWRAVPAPAYLIYGSNSPVVTAAGAQQAAELNPAASIRAVPDAGHMIPWDNPEGFREAMRSVLSEALAGAA